MLEGEHLRLGGDAIKWGSSGMSHGFVLLTDRAPFDVICYPLLHSRPLGILTCLSKGLVPTRMSGRRVVMVNGHQGTFLEEGKVALDPIGFKSVFGNQGDVLIVSVPMVCTQRA